MSNNIFLISSQNKFLKSTNSGSSWTQLTLPGSLSNLTDVIFLNATTGFVCGDPNYFAYTQDGGSTWTQSNAPTPYGQRKLLLDGTTLYMAGSHDSIFVSTNFGVTWDGLALNYPPYPYQPSGSTIFGIDKLSTRIMVAGTQGILKLSQNSGGTWQPLNYSIGNTVHYTSICVVNDHPIFDRILLGKAGGSILRSDNSGANWQEIPTPFKGKIYGIEK